MTCPARWGCQFGWLTDCGDQGSVILRSTGLGLEPWLMLNGQVTCKGKQDDYGKRDAAIRPIALPD